jgi:meiotically up-regulated gene 157 (Mug157) protein
VTYDNVLVWRALRDVAGIYDRIRDVDRTQETLEAANAVRKAVMSHCIVQGPFGEMFAWSVDLEGNYEIHDEPCGSLQMLCWYEFCSPDLPVYRNTVAWIHSKENPYSFETSPFAEAASRRINHPSILAVGNDLLAGNTESALDFLRRVRMDDLIACESVDENTGVASTGLAYASAAGYLSFALASALNLNTEALTSPRRGAAPEKLSIPPPEIRDSIDMGR